MPSIARKPSPNNMNPIQTAWLAGILEGEGCFTVDSRNRVRINCNMTDFDVIRKIKEITGCGTIHEDEFEDKKNRLVWRVSNVKQAHSICKQILPFMHQRRSKRIKKMIKTCERAKENSNTLSEDEVIQIFLDDRTYREIAEEYDCSASQVSRIKNRKSNTDITKNLER